MSYGDSPTPLAIAHRGGAGLGPENTLATFGIASALGFQYLETDVRLTRDGHLVCFHDSTLDRATDGRGRVQQHRLADLAALWVDGKERIPTLADALDAFPLANFTVDLKDEEAIEPLARLLRHRDYAERVCVAGAWDGWLARLRRITPGLQTALGWRSLAALICCARTGARPSRRIATAPYAHVPVRLGALPIFVERFASHAHAIGVRVIVWTVDDPLVMHHLLDMSVDGIITDRPDVLREVMIAKGTWLPMDRFENPAMPRADPGPLG